MPLKKIFIVLGMHRSGTSSVAKLLEVMGIHLGDHLMPPNPLENAKGFWEDMDIYELNTALLKHLGMDWDSPWELTKEEFQELMSGTFMERAISLIKSKIAPHDLFGIKDPRFSVLLPFWDKVFASCGLEPQYILALRNPTNVAMSLKRRNQMKEEEGYILWLYYNLLALKHFDGKKNNIHVVQYESLLKSPRESLAKLSLDLNLKINTQKLDKYISDFIDPSLEHHHFSMEYLRDSKLAPQLLKTLYHDLVMLSYQSQDTYENFFHDNLAQCNKELENLSPFFKVLKNIHSKADNLSKEQFNKINQLNALTKTLGERDAMLSDKDIAWTERLNQTAKDYDLEIARIAAERDAILRKLNSFKEHLPKVSVITVNFNGKKFLDSLIKSLNNQTFPPDEIIVVDNCSSDGSVQYLRENHPKVIVIESPQNLGFAGGNNLGVNNAGNDLLAFINNDAVAEIDWLKNFIFAWIKAQSVDSKISVISPKITFYTPFVRFKFGTETTIPNNIDLRGLGIAIDLKQTRIDGCEYLKPIAIEGFYGAEQWHDGRSVRWSKEVAELYLPVNENFSADTTLILVAMSSQELGQVKIWCEDRLVGEFNLKNEFQEIKIKIPKRIIKSSNWLINNAGSSLDSNGNVSDIGFNLFDEQKFNIAGFVDAFCGCSFFTSKKVFEDFNGFDETFFMYYEDTDLSWRLKKAGQKILYEPKSIVRHIHAGTGGEWSSAFRYYVTRNHSLNIYKNASLKVIVKTVLKSIIKIIDNINIETAILLKRKKLDEMTVCEIEQFALLDALKLLPETIIKRLKKIKKGF